MSNHQFNPSCNWARSPNYGQREMWPFLRFGVVPESRTCFIGGCIFTIGGRKVRKIETWVALGYSQAFSEELRMNTEPGDCNLGL
jgi:hypothetical protein